MSVVLDAVSPAFLRAMSHAHLPPCERLSRTSEGPRRLSQTRGRITFALSLIDVFHNSQ